MRAGILLGYFVLGLAAVLVVGTAAAVWLYRPAPPGPLDAMRPCHLIIGGPTRVYVCARPLPHAWAVQGHEVVDLGPTMGESPRLLPRR